MLLYECPEHNFIGTYGAYYYYCTYISLTVLARALSLRFNLLLGDTILHDSRDQGKVFVATYVSA